MRRLLAWLSALSGPCLFAGCGDDGSGGDGGDPPLEVPAYIDIEVCADVTDDGSADVADRCLACCEGAGFADAGMPYDDTCSCGNLPSGGADQCAAEVASNEECMSCCEAASYLVVSWVGDISCTCFRKQDLEACAGAVSAPEACGRCCLESGYLGYSYAAFGSAECSCYGN